VRHDHESLDVLVEHFFGLLELEIVVAVGVGKFDARAELFSALFERVVVGLPAFDFERVKKETDFRFVFRILCGAPRRKKARATE